LLLFVKPMVSTFEINGIRLEFYLTDRGSETLFFDDALGQFEQRKILMLLLNAALN